MAGRKTEPIQVEAYIDIGGAERNLDEMTPGQRNYIGARLRVRCLNAMFMGRAVFSRGRISADRVGLPGIRPRQQ